MSSIHMQDFENKVKAGILERVSKLGLQDKIGQVLVPTEEVMSIKAGKQRSRSENFSPATSSLRWRWTNTPGKTIKETPKVPNNYMANL